MKRKFISVFSILLVSSSLFLFTSCQTSDSSQVTVTKSTDFEFFQKVKTFLKEKVTVGKTTKKDIIKFGGKPHLRIKIDISEADLFSKRILGGKSVALERWSYMTSSSAKSILNENKLFFLVRVGLLKDNIYAVDFYFDEEDVVQAYEVGEYTT